ncbi:hypothetical protein BJX65DRAFT_314233 [Aspergillus insuetus]
MMITNNTDTSASSGALVNSSAQTVSQEYGFSRIQYLYETITTKLVVCTPQEGSGVSDEEFVLFLQGVLDRCRWENSKAFIRRTASQILQAIVSDGRQGFPTGIGQIAIKDRAKALRAFVRSSTKGWGGIGLSVTVARTKSPITPIAGLAMSTEKRILELSIKCLGVFSGL